MNTKFLKCPICGESDTRAEKDGEVYVYNCTNLNCGSNGGDNFCAFSEPKTKLEEKQHNYPILETEHGIYKVGDSVFVFPNWNKYPMSLMDIVLTNENNMVSIGGGFFSVDLIRHTKLEALIAMNKLRNLEIKRLSDLDFIQNFK